MTTPTPGLRERKKARTRWAIQEHALRLFAEQGYEATTVDQIAAAAEISPSTFFRYFRTKEDVVVQDEFDEQLMAAFHAAGASSDPLGTLKDFVIRAITDMHGEALEQSKQRTELIFANPALRARTVDNVVAGFDEAVRGFAEGRGCSPEDPVALAFVGACLGAMVPLFMLWARDGFGSDFGELYERATTGLRTLLASP